MDWKRSTGAAADSNQMVDCYRLDWIEEELRLHRRITLDCNKAKLGSSETAASLSEIPTS